MQEESEGGPVLRRAYTKVSWRQPEQRHETERGQSQQETQAIEDRTEW